MLVTASVEEVELVIPEPSKSRVPNVYPEPPVDTSTASIFPSELTVTDAFPPEPSPKISTPL